MLAMVVNDNAGGLDAHVVWASFREHARSYHLPGKLRRP